MFKKALKKAGLTAFRAAGISSLIANSNFRKSRLLILCYHGISLKDEHLWDGNLFVSRQHFGQRLAMLKALNANVLPLGEAVERLSKGSLPPRSVVITFDDGFYDFHVNAVPVLREFGYPCTLYLTTHYCFHPVPIFGLAIDYVLWKSQRQAVDLLELDLGLQLPKSESMVLIGSREQRFQVRLQLVKHLLNQDLSTDAKNEMVQRIAIGLGVDYDAILQSRILQLLNPEEAVQTAKAGIDLQLHTHRHRTPREHALFRREIEDNAKYVYEFSGRAPSHFCYPSGDYDLHFLPWLRELGIKSGTTCNLGLAGPQSDPLLLPRLLDDSFVGDLDFESTVCGLRG